jgi:hypothetical protein
LKRVEVSWTERGRRKGLGCWTVTEKGKVKEMARLKEKERATEREKELKKPPHPHRNTFRKQVLDTAT